MKKNKLRKLRPGLTLDSASVQDNVPTEIINGIYIGSVHCAFNKESLADYGITHILNISGVPGTYPRNFTYLQVTMRDKEYANLLSAIPAANIFIESSLDSNGKVLVHCKGGRSRSAAFISAFIMSTQQVSFEKAFQMVKRKRPIVNVNKGFEKQLIAYGRANWNIYGAQQLLLQEHIDLMLEQYESSGQILVRELASRALSTPVRLQLTRPQSSGVQIIPPLRGADMQFVCRQCKTPLFVTSSIVIPSSNRSISTEEEKESPRRKNSDLNREANTKDAGSNPRPPRLRRHYASDTIASFSSEELDDFKLSGGDTNSNLQMKNNARSEPRIKNKLLTHLNANDTFSVPPSPMSRGRNIDQRRSPFHDSEDDADTAYQPTGKDFTNKEANKFNEDKVPKTKNFGVKEKNENQQASSSEEGKREPTGSLTDDSDRYTFTPSTPPLRPKSQEKKRWLSRMKALECGATRPNDRLHRPSLIARNDETRAVDVCARKHFFIEPMEWMGKIDKLSGPLCCANELCKLQLGHYNWRGLSTVGDAIRSNGSKDGSAYGASSKSSSNEDSDELFVVPAFRIESGLVIAQENL